MMGKSSKKEYIDLHVTQKRSCNNGVDPQMHMFEKESDEGSLLTD